MTGYGKSEGTFKKKKYNIEIRSVNNKYCDVSMKYPKQFTLRDFELRELIRGKISRGKLNVNISVETGSGDIGTLFTNESSVKNYLELLKSIKKLIGTKEEITLNHILVFKDLFEAEAGGNVEEEEFEYVCSLLLKAIDDLKKMKAKEGISLKNDLMQRIKFIDKEAAEISKISKQRLKTEKDRINAKVRSIISDRKIIDEGRLELEIVLLSDKIDITEELIRLKSHTKYFVEYAKSSEYSGRRLNFLTQEINREINTIASKSLDADISQKVSVMKEELEKIKEQLQNVE